MILLLNGKGCCGRAVQFEEMSADEVDENARFCAGQLGKESTFIELQQMEVREGLFRCLKAVSKKADLKTLQDVSALTPDDWESLTVHDLKMGKYTEFFGRSKDTSALKKKWQQLHVATTDDIEVIESIATKP